MGDFSEDFRPVPVVLEGRLVDLKPLAAEHTQALSEIGLDPELWRWTTNRVHNFREMKAYVKQALTAQTEGHMLPFVTVLKSGGQVVGCTRFGNIVPAHRRAEIGWTWVGKPWQRSGVNTEAKFLMLSHAFEVWQCIRVELKTDFLNQKSRTAILRLGAREEGVLRQHMVAPDGRLRDTVYYSILDREWPAVKAALLAKMGR
ncbi:MAG: GNAT family N-acetyltransferase [Calditrichaeota bacterium]|nr:GNAT family N-acetyltransferase [Calditrichota bacterium]HQU73689.1 GNAT family protein [Calditrichia bacterium]